jgi:hypothetical protein
MIAIFRFVYVAGFVGGVWLAFTEGFWTGAALFLTVGVTLWVTLTLGEAFQRLTTALSRSSEPQQHVHVYVEPHPDPTRPTWDEQPLIFINKNGGSNGQNYN